MEELKQKKEWYKTWWGIIVVIAFFPILVPVLVWTKSNMSKPVKIAITAICGLVLVAGAIGNSISNKEAINLVAKAESQLAEGKVNEALISITEAKKLNVENDKIAIIEESINNYNSEEFVNKAFLEMTDEEYKLLMAGDLKKVYLKHEKANELFIKKLADKHDLRAKLLAEKAEKEKQAAAEAKIKKEEEEKQQRVDMIQKQFSVWDGSHNNLTKTIKDAMNDPKSYEHVETKYVDKGDYLLIQTTYRGSNAFGAIVKDTIIAKVSLEGDVLEIVE